MYLYRLRPSPRAGQPVMGKPMMRTSVATRISYSAPCTTSSYWLKTTSGFIRMSLRWKAERSLASGTAVTAWPSLRSERAMRRTSRCRSQSLPLSGRASSAASLYVL